MKKTPQRKAPPSDAPDPFNVYAKRAFLSLSPWDQHLVLWMLSHHAKVPPSRLYTTDAQREVARVIAENTKREKKEREAEECERVEIRRKLNAIHNRAQQRRNWRGNLTPAEERRSEKLYARLNEIDGIGGVR